MGGRPSAKIEGYIFRQHLLPPLQGEGWGGVIPDEGWGEVIQTASKRRVMGGGLEYQIPINQNLLVSLRFIKINKARYSVCSFEDGYKRAIFPLRLKRYNFYICVSEKN